MKIKTTKRLAKKYLIRELQNSRSSIKLFDKDLKASLQDEIKTISIFIRKRQLINWININDEGIIYNRKYKFINDIEAFKYIIDLNIGRAVRYYYNRF